LGSLAGEDKKCEEDYNDDGQHRDTKLHQNFTWSLARLAKGKALTLKKLNC
jgi:hypothetical protein